MEQQLRNAQMSVKANDRERWFAGRTPALADGTSSLRYYIFGAHPAWSDRIESSALPEVPPPFADFHLRIQPAIAQAYVHNLLGPRLFLWHEPASSAVVLALPNPRSADGPQAMNRGPLFIGQAFLPGTSSASVDVATRQLCLLAAELCRADLTRDEFAGAIQSAVANDRSFRLTPYSRPTTLLDIAIADLFTRAADELYGQNLDLPTSGFFLTVGEASKPTFIADRLSAIGAETIPLMLGVEPASSSAIGQELQESSDAAPTETDIPDEPFATELPTSCAVSEDLRMPLVLRTPHNRPIVLERSRGNAILITEGDTGYVEVTLTAKGAKVKMPAASGIKIGVGSVDAECILLQFTASASAANEALDGLQIFLRANANQRATLQVRVRVFYSRADTQGRASVGVMRIRPLFRSRQHRL